MAYFKHVSMCVVLNFPMVHTFHNQSSLSLRDDSDGDGDIYLLIIFFIVCCLSVYIHEMYIVYVWILLAVSCYSWLPSSSLLKHHKRGGYTHNCIVIIINVIIIICCNCSRNSNIASPSILRNVAS